MTKLRKKLPIRAAFSVNGENRFKVGDVVCVTRACAEYVRDLLRIGPTDSDIFARINRALEVETDPLTRFPPPLAGDVIGVTLL